MTFSRRKFLQRSGIGGIGLLTFTVAGCEKDMTPAEARRSSVAYAVLTDGEVSAIDALGETIVPGSAANGLAHYIDHQLNAPLNECLLMIRYLGVPAPFAAFYKASLGAAAQVSSDMFSAGLSTLSVTDTGKFVTEMAAGNLSGWQGPPAAFFYFVLRADAVDVTYGTKAGFADLGIPYAAHIEPPSRWGE